MSRTRIRRLVWLVALTAALSACERNKQPAQVQLGEIEGTVSATAADAAKYVPDQLKQVQDEVGGLRTAYEQQDYATVLSGSPQVRRDAQQLAAAASAAKSAALRALNERWTSLSAALPGEIGALRKRVDVLVKQPGKTRPASVDLDAAKTRLAEATSLWSKAQAAFASDNLREAVSAATSVGSQLESLAVTLQLDLGTSS